MAGKDIGPVGVGDSYEQIGLGCSGFLEKVCAGAISRNDEGVDGVLQVGGAALIVLNDDDVLTLGCKSFCQVRTDGPGPDDDYSHFRNVLLATEDPG